MEEIKDRLRRYMNEQDLSLADVASLIGRSTSTVWKILRGINGGSARTLYRLQALLDGAKPPVRSHSDSPQGQ